MNSKKPFLLVFIWALSTFALAQNPTYQQKLYHTCKVWGMVKYYHSRVSVCQVEWDSVLMQILPQVKSAGTSDEFNDVLYNMLLAAGPMEIVTTPSPDTLPAELKRNLNFDWVNDPIFRTDVKVILDTIKNNFRPHTNCWVQQNGPHGLLWFPHDDPMIDSNAYVNFPDESTRLMILFKYWNIINYFNPYNYVLDQPWDSTLFNNVLAMVETPDYISFYKTIKKISACANDAHVEGLTWSSNYSMFGYYIPKILLRYTHGKYVVVKSDELVISVGDIIDSVDHKSMNEWEDILRPFISAGDSSVFRRYTCSYNLRGASGSLIDIGFSDSLGNNQSVSLPRAYSCFSTWVLDYYPNDTLSNVKFRKWDCNVGYVNMGILMSADVDEMYYNLINTSAIIFDIRNYPNGTAWDIADYIYPERMCFAKLTLPDIQYPGTYSWSYNYLGINGNPFNYEGKVIILCNQQTQSQAEYSCMILRVMPDAVVIGSQTAGADGNISYFYLSQEFRAGFTSLGVYYPNGDSTQRIGIVPDSVVFITPSGVRDGRDEVLEKALQVADCLAPMLSVTPYSQQVDTSAGITGFTVTCNTNWSAVSDADWCTVTSSGSGNGTIVAEYTENVTNQPRVANIIVTVAELPEQTVTVHQESIVGIYDSPINVIWIYPNPTSGICRIIPSQTLTGIHEISVQDMFGRVIFSDQYRGEKEYEIDLSFAQKGSYFAIIKNNENIIVQKLIIN